MTTLKPQPPCSECEKLNSVQEKSQPIGEFIDWMQNRGFVISSYDEDGNLYPCRISINLFLAQYFEIDLDKVEQERRALLEWLREVQS
jgi:hypothetical protein